MQIEWTWLRGLWQLIRIIPVVSWSGAGILTTMLPIVLFYHPSVLSTAFHTFFLFLGGLCIQGWLAHAFNDLTDDATGTDQLTEGILSGGSRVLSDRLLTRQTLKRWAYFLLIALLIFDISLFWLNMDTLAMILLIGIWGAFSYSVRPLRLSYLPFCGEWLSAFPSIIVLSLAPPLLILYEIPTWAWQNAIIHGLWSLSWLMFHHIPDVSADQKATPQKRTTVVFAVERWHFKGRHLAPAFFYLFMTALFTITLFFSRPLGATISLGLIFIAIWIVVKSNNHTQGEMGLITLSIVNALWLGCIPFS